MPVEYADIILAVAALIAAALYLRTRRRRKKKSAPPVRPAAPTNQTAGVAATWAPPTPARPAMTPVAPRSFLRPTLGGQVPPRPSLQPAAGDRLPLPRSPLLLLPCPRHP